MIDVIGYAAGFLVMISFIPQVIKTYTSKRAEDISIPMLFLTLTANLLYVFYGILLGLNPVIIMIGIFSFIISVQIILTFKYRRITAIQG